MGTLLICIQSRNIGVLTKERNEHAQSVLLGVRFWYSPVSHCLTSLCHNPVFIKRCKKNTVWHKQRSGCGCITVSYITSCLRCREATERYEKKINKVDLIYSLLLLLLLVLLNLSSKNQPDLWPLMKKRKLILRFSISDIKVINCQSETVVLRKWIRISLQLHCSTNCHCEDTS